ncbi:MAG: hypothetical protein IKT08_03350 [Bacteroidales bacterium]|nr:hypothetical protein [Bacteroidales bacterium]
MRRKKIEVRSKKTEDGRQKTRFTVFLFLLLLLGVDAGSVVAQNIGNYRMDETHLYAMTKQMGQFIRRFNYEEDQFGNQINPKDPAYRNRKKRQQSLAILFDQETYGNQPDLQRFFIEDVTSDDSTFMTFLGGRWYSEVSATFQYKGKDVSLIMILGIEKEGLGSKWVLNNIYFSEFNKLFPKGEITEKEKHFLHPMSHELDFMNIYKIFKEPEIIEYYASKNFQPDYLTLFFYEIKRGNLIFKNVDSVKFHVFQIKDWYFEVSWFNRSGNNAGWLISNLIYLPEKDKKDLINFYEP